MSRKKTATPAGMTDEQVIEFALDQMSAGGLLSEIAEELGIARKTLFARLQATPELMAAYARAREDGHDARAERLTRLAAEAAIPHPITGAVDPGAIAHMKLRIDTEKWLLAKVAPRKYGDKLAIGGAEDLPPVKSEVVVDAAEAYKRLVEGS